MHYTNVSFLCLLSEYLVYKVYRFSGPGARLRTMFAGKYPKER